MSYSLTVQREAQKQMDSFLRPFGTVQKAPYRPLQAILVRREPKASRIGRLVMTTRGDYRVTYEKDGGERVIIIL